MRDSKNPRTHVFISYARSDGEDIARRLHERLETEEHLDCWRDRLDLEGGENFWRQLEDGISGARWLVIVLTPGALKSEWTAREWREAHKRGVPVCPVWPFDERSLASYREQSRLSAGLQRSHVYTPFATTEAAAARAVEEWRNLVATLHREKDVSRTLFMAPALPPDFVDRPSEITAALSNLLTRKGGQSANVAVLRGAGGMGKTTLAAAVAHREEITETFYDGVLWVTLGTRPNLTVIVEDLCRALQQDIQFSDLNAGTSHLRAILENRCCLLVVDDVWRITDLQPFVELGSSIATLVTTRVADVARAVGDERRTRVDLMTEDQAATFLLSAVPDEQDSLMRHHCRELARHLGRWPLLLRLAGGQLRAQLECGEAVDTAIKWVIDCLRQSGATALDVDPSPDFADSRTRQQAFAVSIGGSLTLLADSERQAFVDLGVFPEDVAVPFATAAQLWGVRDVKGIALRLANLALIDVQLGTSPTLTLHDQIHQFAARRLTDEGRWSQANRRLVDTWKDPSMPPDDYAWRWVCRHLKEAGLEDRLKELLLDYDGIARRLNAKSVGVHRLVSDYQLIGHIEDGAHVGRALQRASHILASRPELLPQQLVGRLTRESDACESLRGQARSRAPQHVLLPRTPSLATRGGVVREVLRHTDGVSGLALTGDGRLVTAGGDGHVYCAPVHALEGGPILLAQHASSVYRLALTGDGRVVTSGRDGRVYCAPLDGGEPVLLAKHLGGLAGAAWCLALTGDQRVVSGGWDGRVYCASLDGGDAQLLVQHEGAVTHLTLTGDGRVVTGAADGRVCCVCLDGGEPLLLAHHTRSVSQLALTPDGRVVTAGQDGRVCSSTLDGGEAIVLVQHKGWNDESWGDYPGVQELVLTGDGRVLTAGELDGLVYCLGLDGTDAPVLLAQHAGGVSQLKLAADGRVVTGGRQDGRVCCTTLDGREPTLLAQHHGKVNQLQLTGDGRVVYGVGGLTNCSVYCASLVPDVLILLARYVVPVSHLILAAENQAIVVNDHGRVDRTTLDGGEPVLVAQHEDKVSHVALTVDGGVVTGGSDGRVYFAMLGENGRMSADQPDGPLSKLVLTGNGSIIAAGTTGRVCRARLNDGQSTRLVQHDYCVTHVVLTGDGRVVTGGDDGRVFCSHVDGGEPIVLVRHKASVINLTLIGDGRLMTEGEDCKFWCVDLGGGDPRLLAHTCEGLLVATGDGRLVIADADGRVCCSPVDGGGQGTPIAQHEGQITQLAPTSDGRIVTGGKDGRVFCASLEGGATSLLAQHPTAVERLLLTDDGRFVSMWRDGWVCCGKLDDGELSPFQLGFLTAPSESRWACTDDGRAVYVGGANFEEVWCINLDNRVAAALVSHAGGANFVLTGHGSVVTGGSRDGRVCCTSLEGGEPGILTRHNGGVKSIRVIQDGRFVVSTGNDATLMVTRLSDSRPEAVFVSDLGFTHVEYDAATRVLVAADAGGNLHILPLDR